MEQILSVMQQNLNNEQIIERLKINGELIENFEKTPERCLVAVKQNGIALKYIPDSMQTIDLIMEAINQDINAFEFVAKELITAELCDYAVSVNGEIIKYIPKKFITEELMRKAVISNGLCIEYIDNKTYDLCLLAVCNNIRALNSVPKVFRDDNLYTTAIDYNWHSFERLPERYYNLKYCLLLLEYYSEDFSESDLETYKRCFHHFPKRVLCHPKVAERVIELKLYDINKGFNPKDKTFYVKHVLGYAIYAEFTFDDFEEFLQFVGYNLDGARLKGFDFKGIDVSKLDLSKSIVNDEIFDFDITDDFDVDFYNENVKIYNKDFEKIIDYPQETLLSNEVNQNNIVPKELLKKSQRENCNIYYISDLHLIHKLNHKFLDASVNKTEIKKYIKEIVVELVESTYDSLSESGNILLIAGDVSLDYNVAELFYEILVKYWDSSSIVVVLGNHDFWDKSQDNQTLEDVVLKYKQLFNRLGVNFLHNDLLVIKQLKKYPSKRLILRRTKNTILNIPNVFFQCEIISEDMLKTMTLDEIREICLSSVFSVLGGTGFSGLCDDFNATNGIYRDKMQTLSSDIEQSKRFEDVYQIVKRALGKDKVIVLTHMPKDNWTKSEYNENWIYVNGHTHRNYCLVDENKEVYADNQIGYENKSFFLKSFSLSSQYDIFRYYKDGKYEITRKLYEQFNKGKGILVDFNQKETSLYMLKRNNLYCFLCKNQKTGIMYFLKGGLINKVSQDRNLDYYYDNMISYSNAIESIFSEYYNLLKIISGEIKRLGGTGIIHGCIVDIDFSNHIYVNIIDGKITPYYASSMKDKYIYDSIPSLLKKQREDLYTKYLEIEGEIDKSKCINHSNALDKKPLFVSDTTMYKSSRIMKNIQYLFDDGIIRVWNDKIVEEFGKMNYIES